MEDYLEHVDVPIDERQNVLRTVERPDCSLLSKYDVKLFSAYSLQQHAANYLTNIDSSEKKEKVPPKKA